MRNETNKMEKVEGIEREYQMLFMMIAEGIIDQNEGNFMLTALGSEIMRAKKEVKEC